MRGHLDILGGWSSDIGIDDGQQMAVPFDDCISPQGSLCCRRLVAAAGSRQAICQGRWRPGGSHADTWLHAVFGSRLRVR